MGKSCGYARWLLEPLAVGILWLSFLTVLLIDIVVSAGRSRSFTYSALSVLATAGSFVSSLATETRSRCSAATKDHPSL